MTSSVSKKVLDGLEGHLRAFFSPSSSRTKMRCQKAQIVTALSIGPRHRTALRRVPNMDVTLSPKGGWIIVSVKGRIDAFNYDILSTRLSTLRKTGKKQVAIDLSHSSFLNLSAARLLASYGRFLAENGGSLVVITDQKRTREVLTFFSHPNDVRYCSLVSELEGQKT